MEDSKYYDNNISAYCCRNCGTVFYNNDMTTCVFCNNVLIEKKDIILEKEKIYIVPFEKSMKNAISTYKKKVLFNPFVPFYFKSRKTIEKMKQVYIPSYFLDVNVTGSPLFLAMDKNNVVRDHKRVVEKKKYKVLFSTNFDYNKLVVSKFSKIALLFETVCSNGSDKLVEYDHELPKDIPIIYEDLTAMDVSNQLRDKILISCLKTIRKIIPHDLKKIEQNNMTIKSSDVKKVLFPVYLLNVFYKEKNYYFLMNGENGKAFAETYFSKWCIFAFTIFIFILIFVLALLIVYFI